MAQVESISFEGEYPTGVYWSIGEIRELDDEYLSDLPDGLSLVAEAAEAEAEGTVTAEEWATVAEAARGTGDEVAATAADTCAAVLTKLEEGGETAEADIAAAEDAAARIEALADEMEAEVEALRAAAAAITAGATKAREKLG